MKKTHKYIAILFGALTLSSCSDWLDIVPEGTIPTEEVDFSDASQMYSPVSGVYATARAKMTQWEIWPLFNVRGDEVTKGGGSTADQADFLKLEDFSYDAMKGFWASNSAWIALYQIVYTSHNNTDLLNRFRAELTNDADKALANQYEAEMVFHRAMAYYFISNLWGAAPIIDADDINYAYPHRSSQGAIRALIHKELDFCIKNLPANQPSHKGAATKYSAMTLKAKLALLEGNYELVKTLTDDIIANSGASLYSDFYELFKIPGKLAPESLYEFQFTDFGAGDGDEVYGGSWFQHQGPRNNPAPISGWGFMMIEKNFIEFMKGRGETIRYDVAVLESGTTTRGGDEIAEFRPDFLDIKAHYNGKAYVPKNQYTEGRNSYGSNNNIRLLRYADVLLMNAEAALEVGGDVATPLNLVRERAKMATIANPTLEDILNERRAELSVEWGDRFNDLVRRDLASTTLEGFVKGKHEFLPIPTAQEDLNPNLKGSIK